VYTVLDTPVAVEFEREYIVSFPQRGVFCVAEGRQGQRVIGFQRLEPFASYAHPFDHVGAIGTFAELSQRRKGVGKRLSEVTLEIARGKGYEKLFTVIWSPEAIEDIESIAAYISRDSKRYVSAVVGKILDPGHDLKYSSDVVSQTDSRAGPEYR